MVATAIFPVLPIMLLGLGLLVLGLLVGKIYEENTPNKKNDLDKDKQREVGHRD